MSSINPETVVSVLKDQIENYDQKTEVKEEGRIIQINIEEEMKTAYIDYSMSVIVSRALALGSSDAMLHMHCLQRKIKLICALSFYLI